MTFPQIEESLPYGMPDNAEVTLQDNDILFLRRNMKLAEIENKDRPDCDPGRQLVVAGEPRLHRSIPSGEACRYRM